MWSKKGIILLVFAMLCVTFTIFACLFFVSIGTSVIVFASTSPHEVSINGCTLKTVYVLGFNSPESSISDGDRVIVMKVFSGQTEIFTVEKTNIDNRMGNYFIYSSTLPSDLSVNSELRVEIQLRYSGTTIAQDETTILYK